MAFFQTLRGKLIMTYTMVTVLALLALEITLLAVVFVFSRGLSTNTLSYLADVIAVMSPQARAYLQPGARDLAGLQAWLQVTYDSGYASLPPQSAFDNPAAPILKTDAMYVLAPDGTILAAAPASVRSLVGRQYSPPAGSIRRAQEILDNALQMQLQSGQVSALRPDGNYLMAVPVQQQLGEGPLVAVIIVTVKAPPVGVSKWWPLVLGLVPATGLILLLAVAPFGALFGFIMSRGLTRRLKTLSLAADAWSEGNFSAQPAPDRSQDEISYLGVRLRRMAERIQTLLQTQQELALLEERNRLARELHDTVKQESFATLMQVRAARNLLERDPASARERMEAAEQLIKTSQQELEQMISALRPSALDGQGLAGALSDYLTSWSQHSRIPADLQVQNERRLPLELEQAFFRVAQEALSNVARHSRASAVSVRLAFELERVTLCISDNGAGFDPDAASGGFGMQSMRERMAAIQGKLVIEAAPDGVSVKASAPTHQQEQK
jgi:NarL family two-component system sensor histidine kinase LiaS